MFFDKITGNMDSGVDVDAIFLDFETLRQSRDFWSYGSKQMKAGQRSR